MPASDALRYRAAQIGAALIGRLPLNEVTLVASCGVQRYRKRRRWYAPLLIAAGRIGRPRFLVLSGAAWATWERAVYAQLYGEPIGDSLGALELPARPGQPLAQLLAGAKDLAAAAGAVGAALRALADTHQQVIAIPGDAPRPFSHGDATAQNVTYLDRPARAWWFDFETTHPADWPHARRCADDMRALLFSAAAPLGEGAVDALARLPAAHYPHPAVLSALGECVRELIRRPDPLHIAQTRADHRLNRALAHAILRELDRAPAAPARCAPLPPTQPHR